MFLNVEYIMKQFAEILNWHISAIDVGIFLHITDLHIQLFPLAISFPLLPLLPLPSLALEV